MVASRILFCHYHTKLHGPCGPRGNSHRRYPSLLPGCLIISPLPLVPWGLGHLDLASSLPQPPPPGWSSASVPGGRTQWLSLELQHISSHWALAARSPCPHPGLVLWNGSVPGTFASSLIICDHSLIAFLLPHLLISKLSGPCTTLSFLQLIDHPFPLTLFGASPEPMVHVFNHSLAKACKPLPFYICPQNPSLGSVQSAAFWLLHASSCLLLEKPIHAKECLYDFNVPNLSAIHQTLCGSSGSLTVHICNSRCCPLPSSALPTAGSLPRWFVGFVVTWCGLPHSFWLLSGNLHHSTSCFPGTCEYRPLPSSPGLWSIVMALWCHTFRNKCTTPILKVSSINLSLPFRGCLSPFVGWKERPSWGDYTFQCHKSRLWGWFLPVALRFLEQRGSVPGQVTFSPSSAVDIHCFQILPSLLLFDDF